MSGRQAMHPALKCRADVLPSLVSPLNICNNLTGPHLHSSSPSRLWADLESHLLGHMQPHLSFLPPARASSSRKAPSFLLQHHHTCCVFCLRLFPPTLLLGSSYPQCCREDIKALPSLNQVPPSSLLLLTLGAFYSAVLVPICDCIFLYVIV